MLVCIKEMAERRWPEEYGQPAIPDNIKASFNEELRAEEDPVLDHCRDVLQSYLQAVHQLDDVRIRRHSSHQIWSLLTSINIHSR